MNGYEELEQILIVKRVCVVITNTRDMNLDDGHVDVEIFSGHEPDPKMSFVQVLNAKSAEDGLKKALDMFKGNVGKKVWA